jgi:LmbE family N-acetylglucosaminyl deacetylase
MSASSILVVAAHPDDEVLGCGGTIARHARAADRVTVLIMADGVGSRGIEPAGRPLDERRAGARRASQILGVHDLILLSYPDNQMDTIPLLQLVKEVEAVIGKCSPTVVYTHHRDDVNVDHTRTHEAVIAACRPQPGRPVERLLFFETASSTEWRPPASGAPFAPNWFTDISETLPVKLAALAAYGTELRDFPHSRSMAAIEHLARWRGAAAGVAAAEAFELGRMIVR